MINRLNGARESKIHPLFSTRASVILRVGFAIASSVWFWLPKAATWWARTRHEKSWKIDGQLLQWPHQQAFSSKILPTVSQCYHIIVPDQWNLPWGLLSVSCVLVPNISFLGHHEVRWFMCWSYIVDSPLGVQELRDHCSASMRWAWEKIRGFVPSLVVIVLKILIINARKQNLVISLKLKIKCTTPVPYPSPPAAKAGPWWLYVMARHEKGP
jgi:hypothetical protein